MHVPLRIWDLNIPSFKAFVYGQVCLEECLKISSCGYLIAQAYVDGGIAEFLNSDLRRRVLRNLLKSVQHLL